MTEEEAKTKICHKTMASVRKYSNAAPSPSPSPCIGSACMAWRWGVAHPDGGFIEAVPNRAIAASRAGDKGYVVGGYCGLAGKP